MHRDAQRLLLLACTVAVAACSGQSKQSSGAPTTQKGQFGVNYVVTVSPPVGGKVISVPAGTIDCGTIGAATTTVCSATYVWGVDAVFTAVPDQTNSSNPWFFQAWAGSCGGGEANGGCIVGTNGDNGADKTVVAVFNPADQLGHARIPSGAVHGPMYYAFMDGAAGALTCTNCHGASLQGLANAPSCASCHALPPTRPVSGHFDAAAEAWSSHTASGACVRCHTVDGFQDYIGLTGPDNHLDNTYLANGTAFAPGPMKCTTCHNDVSDPTKAGLTSVSFVSLARVDNLDTRTALCSQCHQGRKSTPDVNSSITSKVAVASRGLGIVSLKGTAAGTTTTLAAAAATVDMYKGYTLVFTNNANQGTKVTVSGNTLTAVSFPAVATATALNDAATLWPTATGGTIDSNAAKGKSMPIINRGIDLLDANRNWTAAQWTGFYVYIQDDPINPINNGLYRLITGNTATSLTVAAATLATGMPFPAPIGAGTRYLILPKEDTTVLDAVAATISFDNVHYLSAGATLQGSDARVGYQYPKNWGRGEAAEASVTSYADRNWHGVSQSRCTSCHDPHQLVPINVTVSTCGRCHFNDDGTPVSSFAQLEEHRQYGFAGDIDGDGVIEGLRTEIAGLSSLLFQAIQNYAKAKSVAICYDPVTNPYFFKDTNADGACSATEAVSTNVYTGSWTARLERAAYNYQYSQKEPGTWAHNPRYIIEMLYDAVRDLNIALPTNLNAATGGQVGYACIQNTEVPALVRPGVLNIAPIARSDRPLDADGTCTTQQTPPTTKYFTALRSFSDGHFAGMAGAFRNRDTTVNTAGGWGFPCSRCHSGQEGFEGFLNQSSFLDNTAPYAAAYPSAQGMQCTTCHAPLVTDTNMKRLRDIGASAAGGVRMPGHLASGQILDQGTYGTLLTASSFAKPIDMVCSSCHDGRDMNGPVFEKYLDGTWSGFDLPGQAFSGTATIAANGTTIRISGLPTYLAPVDKGTPNNWLYTTACQAVGKYITISGATNSSYNSTFTIAACGNGTADLNVTYVGDETTVSWAAWTASTKNTHDIQSAIRVFGADAKGGVQYASKTYTGTKQHHGQIASCTECHSPIGSRHSMEVPEAAKAGKCAPCHTGTDYTTWFKDSRALASGNGYDGDATTTTLATELVSFRRGVAAAMNTYQRLRQGTTVPSICWNDTNQSLRAVAGNTDGWCPTGTVAWNGLDPKLARAGYNLIWASTSVGSADPGGWAHNFDYIAQLVYDSAQDLNGGAAVTYVNGATTYTLTRP